MRPLTRPRAAIVVLACALPGCAAPHASIGASTATPSRSRHPDGVFVDPPSAMVEPQRRASTDVVVALRADCDARDARRLVRAFFRAFVREDIDAVAGLLSPDASQLYVTPRTSRAALVELFRGRMKNLDYAKLAGIDAIGDVALEQTAFDEFVVGRVARRPSEMKRGDRLVRVTVVAARMLGQRYFGEIVILLVREIDGDLKIAGFAEEDAS